MPSMCVCGQWPDQRMVYDLIESIMKSKIRCTHARKKNEMKKAETETHNALKPNEKKTRQTRCVACESLGAMNCGKKQTEKKQQCLASSFCKV